jgi:phage terminase large subunit GpA-like protein
MDGATDDTVTALIRQAVARALAPPPTRTLSAFADAERILGPEEGPYAGAWRTDRVPYMREPMDVAGLMHPANRVTFCASAQIGKTQLEVNLLCQIAVETPAPVLVVVPSLDEARTWNKDKLQPAIDNSPRVRAAVADLISRDETGSTTLRKVFAGGNIEITGANSSKGLQSRTKRVVVLDEVSEFPQDVDGRGDPVDLAEARTLAYRSRREHKIIAVSTPKLKGSCRITARYEEGSRAAYHVPCPHCGTAQELTWDNLTWPDGRPEEARYACTACGTLIEHRDKAGMIAAGTWVHERPELVNIHPSYRINALYSPFVGWSDMAREYERVRDDPVAMKAFDNQWLGIAHEARYDIPAADILHSRREPLPPRRIPPWCLFLTGATDVQGNRLEWAVYGWDRDGGATWIDGGVIEGDPALDPVWAEHDALLAQEWRDAWGKAWRPVLWGIDAGYLSQRVYWYCRRNSFLRTPQVMALDGRPRWGLPAIGSPKSIDVDYLGKKVGVVQLWPVGTWDLKTEVASALKLSEQGPDPAGVRPKGAMRFPDRLSLDFFEQITAEALRERPLRAGYVIREWVKVKQRNEQFDLAVYCRALYRHVTVGFDDAAWARVEAERWGTEDALQSDLFAPSLMAARTPAPPPPPPAPVAEERPAFIRPRNDWFRPRGERWL